MIRNLFRNIANVITQVHGGKMKNREIAKKLNEIADILEFNKVEWKPKAYRSAARKIDNMSEEIEDIYKENAGVKKIDYAGSLRRMKETIGDIDLLVVSDTPEKVMDSFVNAPGVKRVIRKGRTKAAVLLDEGINADLRVIEEDSYGSAFQYFTGNKDHNIAVRNIALAKGYKLSEYGLFRKDTNEKISGKSEEDIYKKLGLKWIPPELRQNRGEIEAAKNKDLSKLLELGAIKGDLQMHTRYSDGYDKIEDMAKKAKALGYEYIAITDHSRSETIAKGLSEKELKNNAANCFFFAAQLFLIFSTIPDYRTKPIIP